jgi:hypothetical protein
MRRPRPTMGLSRQERERERERKGNEEVSSIGKRKHQLFKPSIISAYTAVNIVNDKAGVRSARLFVMLSNIFQNFLPRIPEECG